MVHGARSRRAPRFLSIHVIRRRRRARLQVAIPSILARKALDLQKIQFLFELVDCVVFSGPGLIQADIALSETLNPDE